jgi:hypothetical protein
MERIMLESLYNVPLTQIQRYVADSCQPLNHSAHTLVYSFANRSARLMDAYRNGLDGAQAAWANRKYHGHRTLPSTHIQESLARSSARE